MNFFIIIISSFLFFVSCIDLRSLFSIDGIEYIDPEGTLNKRDFEVDMFRYLEIDLNADVELIQSDSLFVSIDGFKNILDLIDVKVSNSKMTIKFKKYITHKTDLDIKIYVPAIQFILMNGSGNFKIDTWENEDRLHIKNNGSAKFYLSNLKQIKHLSIELSGGGSFESFGVSEKINTVHCVLNGSGNVNFEEFNFSSSILESNGSGNIQIGETENLNVSLIGSGNISYKGFPKIHQKILGSGTLIQK